MHTPTLPSDLLQGRTILVTGGGSGLGLAMAKRFYSLGARVAICGRTEARLNQAAAEIGEARERVLVSVTDVREPEAVEQMVESIWSAWGRIDGLVNNAAGNFFCASEDLTPNAFRSVIDIVLHGTFNCTRSVGRRMIENKIPGSMVNIITSYAETGSAFVLPSACAKAGVRALTKSLAFEWATYGIRLNAIAPGPFPTEGAWSRLMPKEFEESYRKRIPLGRFGEPPELATFAALLLSDLTAYMTGDCVTFDGGERLREGQFNFLTELKSRAELKQLFSGLKSRSGKGG